MEMWGMEQNGSSWGARGGWDGGPLPDPQLPFEKNCGEDNQCVPDLRVALSFSGLEELVVGVTEEVTVTVTVHNVGEDAYGAHVELQHPKALSYRKATALQPHRRSLAQHCSSVSPGGGRILCNISHPVLWAGQQVGRCGAL